MSERVFWKENPEIQERVSRALSIEPPFFGIIEGFSGDVFLTYLECLAKASGLEDGYIERLVKKHLLVMEAYFEALLEYEGFRDLVATIVSSIDEEVLRKFLQALVSVHDFGKFVFEGGSVSLVESDEFSDELLEAVLPQIFDKSTVDTIRGCLHSIHWITREIELPESNDELSPSQKLALILKAVDTLGKAEIDERGNYVLRHPNVFFAEGGGYFQWLEEQEEQGRLPVIVNGKTITANVYAEMDIKLTTRGIRLCVALLGIENFDDLWLEAYRNYTVRITSQNHKSLPQIKGILSVASEISDKNLVDSSLLQSFPAAWRIVLPFIEEK